MNAETGTADPIEWLILMHLNMQPQSIICKRVVAF